MKILLQPIIDAVRDPVLLGPGRQLASKNVEPTQNDESEESDVNLMALDMNETTVLQHGCGQLLNQATSARRLKRF